MSYFLKKIQLFCKKGLRTSILIGNIYFVVATEQRRQRIQALQLIQDVKNYFKKVLDLFLHLR